MYDFWYPAPLDPSVSPLVKQSVAERWTTVSLRNGLQSLPDALLAQISENGVSVFMEQPCTKLTFENGKAKVRHAHTYMYMYISELETVHSF